MTVQGAGVHGAHGIRMCLKSPKPNWGQDRVCWRALRGAGCGPLAGQDRWFTVHTMLLSAPTVHPGRTLHFTIAAGMRDRGHEKDPRPRTPKRKRWTFVEAAKTATVHC